MEALKITFVIFFIDILVKFVNVLIPDFFPLGSIYVPYALLLITN